MEFSRARGNPSRKFMEIPGSGGSNVKPPATENLGDGGQTGKKPWKVWIFLSVSKGLFTCREGAPANRATRLRG